MARMTTAAMHEKNISGTKVTGIQKKTGGKSKWTLASIRAQWAACAMDGKDPNVFWFSLESSPLLKLRIKRCELDAIDPRVGVAVFYLTRDYAQHRVITLLRSSIDFWNGFSVQHIPPASWAASSTVSCRIVKCASTERNDPLQQSVELWASWIAVKKLRGGVEMVIDTGAGSFPTQYSWFAHHFPGALTRIKSANARQLAGEAWLDQVMAYPELLAVKPTTTADAITA